MKHKLASFQSNDPDSHLTKLLQHQKKSIVIGFKDIKNLPFTKTNFPLGETICIYKIFQDQISLQCPFLQLTRRRNPLG